MMSSHLSLMDWEPAECYSMDIDEKTPLENPYFPISYTAGPLSPTEEVHMASPVLVSQPSHLPLPIIEDDFNAFFLPPLELNTKPLTFPPLEFPAVPRLAWEQQRNAPLGVSSSFVPAALVESSATVSASSQGACYTTAVTKDHHVLERSVTSQQNAKMVPLSVDGDNAPVIPTYVPIMPTYHPGRLVTSPPKARVVARDSLPLPSNSDRWTISITVAPPLSKSRKKNRGVSPIVMPVSKPKPLPSILEEKLLDGQSGDKPTTSQHPPIESTIPIEQPDNIVGNDIAPSNGEPFAESVTPTGWPDWVVGQDVTPSTPQTIVAETNTPPGWPDWIADEDTTPISQYPVLESTIPEPQTTTFQECVDSGVDLIDLSNQDSDDANSDSLIDESAFRAFGGSSLADLDWILEGFRATNVPDACTASDNASNGFEWANHGIKFIPIPLGSLSLVSPYDWAPVSEVGPDLISFDSAQDLGHRSAETAHVLTTAQSGSFELPSFKSGQTELNGLFQTSTPAPCKRSVFEDLLCAAAAPTLDNASHPEVVITACDSQYSLDCSPVSDTSDVQSHSPFDPIYHHGDAWVEFSKAAYTVERNALRNVKAFKSKLSVKVQKLRVKTKNSGFLGFLAASSRDAATTTCVGKENDIDIEHDVFGEIAKVVDKKMTRSTKVDASTQTEKVLGAHYSLRPPRQYSPCLRYSPYWRSGRDVTFDSSSSVDLDHAQLTHEELESVASGTSCVLPSFEDNVSLGCNIQEPDASEPKSEDCLTKEHEEVGQEKEKLFPGAYPFEEDVYVLEEPANQTLVLADLVELGEKKGFDADLVPCPSLARSVLYSLENSICRFVSFLLDW